MSSGNQFERVWKLQASANQLVLDGKRTPESYAEILQAFVFGAVLPDINWQLTYRKMEMEREYEAALKAGLVVPEVPHLWTSPMIKGVTSNKVVAAYRRDQVKIYLYRDDLDAGMKHDRNPNDGSYVIGFRKTVETDEENKNKSANVLATENHKGITLPERLLLGYGYYVTTDQHLDVKCFTLCAGSRGSGGSVPSVGWSTGGDGVYVNCYAPDDSTVSLRSRSAVSLTAES